MTELQAAELIDLAVSLQTLGRLLVTGVGMLVGIKCMEALLHGLTHPFWTHRR